jgi:hypothetical protein
MPSLGGATEWCDPSHSAPPELRSRAVLVNFWTLMRYSGVWQTASTLLPSGSRTKPP